MSDSRLILLTGLPATGKTTLARRVAARYRLALIAKDLIKEPLLDAFGASDLAQSRRLSDISFAVLFALARELHGTGSDVLLEGNFRPGEHERALRAAAPSLFASAVAANFCQVLCRVEESERLARLLRRRCDPDRHAGHDDAALAAARAGGGAGFLDLPGARFVYDAAPENDLPAGLDDWWNSRTVSLKARGR